MSTPVEPIVMCLSRKVPARTKTLTAKWCRKEFLEMSPQYRAIRGTMRNKMDTCYWCKHKFQDGEMMALACFDGVKGGNKVLCQDCATELVSPDA